MSVAGFIVSMAEAGIKKFDARIEPDEGVAELREQRNDLEAELRDARERIERLEDELHHGERRAILEFVRDNPGCTHGDITKHVKLNAPDRVRRKLDTLEGDAITRDGEEIYLADKGGGGST